MLLYSIFFVTMQMQRPSEIFYSTFYANTHIEYYLVFLYHHYLHIVLHLSKHF